MRGVRDSQWNIFLKMERVSGPLTRMTASADVPCGVAGATIVCSTVFFITSKVIFPIHFQNCGYLGKVKKAVLKGF